MRQLLLKQALHPTAGAFVLVCGMSLLQQACCISEDFCKFGALKTVEELLMLLAGGLH